MGGKGKRRGEGRRVEEREGASPPNILA